MERLLARVVEDCGPCDKSEVGEYLPWVCK